MKNIKTKLITILLLIMIVFSCSKPLTPFERNAKYQEPREYAAWLSNQKSLWENMGFKGKDPRFSTYKAMVESNKRMIKEAEQDAKIKSELEKIKSKIK